MFCFQLHAAVVQAKTFLLMKLTSIQKKFIILGNDNNLSVASFLLRRRHRRRRRRWKACSNFLNCRFRAGTGLASGSLARASTKAVIKKNKG